ncbi:NAD-dependent epimerase/dehydratase family protein [Sungkyunkwania multivorans]|uniref:NAD-dependent epimerase/dehydratase family protein n=1 Tax=Sungkyunkwania multivorans TaxID=1173618 RepID=A0ABW3CU85_9FLAO
MILVTGGTGLVGSHLLLDLTKQDIRVRATYRNPEKLEQVKEVFSFYSENVDQLFALIEWVKADITDIPSLKPCFEGITKVYHCAALISFDPNDYDKLKKTNIEGTANIVNLSISQRVEKLCYVSSIAALGEKRDGQFITEEATWNVEADNDCYAISKYGAEIEVWRGSQEGLNMAIVNPGVIIGAGFWDSPSGQLFTAAARGFKYKVPGVTGYADVKDVCKALLMLMESNKQNERYILVAENRSFESICKKIAVECDSEPPSITLKNWMIQLAWRLDWFRHFVFRKKRRLTKQLTHTAWSLTYFSNEKITKALNFNFNPIDDTIEEVAAKLMKD